MSMCNEYIDTNGNGWAESTRHEACAQWCTSSIAVNHPK